MNILIKKIHAGEYLVPLYLDSVTGRFHATFSVDGEMKQATSLSQIECERVVQEALVGDHEKAEIERLERLKQIEATAVRLNTRLINSETHLRLLLRHALAFVEGNAGHADLRERVEKTQEYLTGLEKADAEERARRSQEPGESPTEGVDPSGPPQPSAE